jgi:transposase-like protein
MKGKGAQEMSQNQSKKSSYNGSAKLYLPNVEVVPQAKRRRFSEAEKRRILEEADACTEPGEIGALLRREGIYSSYLADWRREREKGQWQGRSGQPRDRPRNEDAAEVSKLRQENERLKAQLAQAELIITAQKKLSQALEQTLSPKQEGRS